jgi:hypothetical protein
MSLIPKFWSRVVFLIDPPATPLSALLSALSWSPDVQLDVIITRRAFHDSVDRDHEKAQILSIMNIIGSHIHRIRTLRFEVMFSSSLPSFPTDFHGTATILNRLELQCKADEGGSDNSISAALSIPAHEEFECPILSLLVIDGRNYYEACRRNAGWIDKISTVLDLTISHFKPRPGESFSIYELLLPLTAVRFTETVRITDVVFHSPHEELDILDPPRADFLFFEDMHDPQAMVQIVNLLGGPHHIWFTRCSFGGIADTFGHFGSADFGGNLMLRDIDQDMAPLLRLWDAYDLDIHQCPSFDDVILDLMGSEDNGTFACATYLRALTICNCSNFSIAALRRFVESRLHFPHLSYNGDELTPMVTRVRILHLSGNIPPISEADRAWFVANVSEFYEGRW